MFIVRVYVEEGRYSYQAQSLARAVKAIGSRLNDCYPPGKIVFRVTGHEGDQIDDGLDRPDITYTR